MSAKDRCPKSSSWAKFPPILMVSNFVCVLVQTAVDEMKAAHIREDKLLYLAVDSNVNLTQKYNLLENHFSIQNIKTFFKI